MEKFHAFFDVGFEAENYEDAKRIAEVLREDFSNHIPTGIRVIFPFWRDEVFNFDVQLTEVEED